jgi:uncharacterized protein (DUF1778 family)
MAAAQRGERIDLRLAAELKTLLARAASYCGMSLSSFLVSSAAQRAKEVVAGHETLTLTKRDWQAFLAGLDKADRGRARLSKAAKHYLRHRLPR